MTMKSPQNELYGPDYYDRQLHRPHWFRNNAAKNDLRRREVLRMLELAPSDRVLDLGCASGEHAFEIAKHCSLVVGVDSSDAAIERAKARASAEASSNVEFLVMDATDLAPLRDASFDKIAAIDFTEHLDDHALAKCLDESRRVLGPGGKLAIFTPCASHFVERFKAHNVVLKQIPGHIGVRAPRAYEIMLERAGFAIGRVWFSPSTYPLFGNFDRWFADAPIIGPWFRFRICMTATAP